MERNCVAMEMRAAACEDTDTVAILLTQLYEVEAPGMIDGDRNDCAQLVKRALDHAPAEALSGTYLVLQDDEPLGMGAVSTAEAPRRPLWYPDMRRDSRGLLGRSRGGAFIRGVSRLMGALITPIAGHQAQLHSIVVERGVRHCGVGAHILRVLEEAAIDRDKRDAVLTVLNGNPAKRFYERYGYRTSDTPRTPWWRRRRAAYPSITMSRSLRDRCPTR